MQHLTVVDKSLLVGDEVAEVLLEYAALLGDSAGADTVRINAISADGNHVIASVLLNAGVGLVAETANSQLPEPENGEAVEYMRSRLDGARALLLASPEEVSGATVWNAVDD